VLYVRAFYNGGTDAVVIALGREFVRRGFSVVYLVDYHNAHSPFLALLPSGAEYVVLDARSAVQRLARFRRFLRDYVPRVLISSGYFPNVVAVCAQILERSDTRIIVVEHNSPSFVRRTTPVWQPRHWFNLIARMTFPRAFGIVAVSRGTARDLASELRLPPARITAIYNPVIDDHLYESARAPIEDSWFSRLDQPLILALGRLEPQKNHASLLRAFHLLRQRIPCRLVIMGEGSLRGALEQQVVDLGISNHVRIHGFERNPHAYTSRASLLVLSSVWEGLSCVLIEALALGTPVVSTDCPFGPSEVLGAGEYGILVPVENDLALAEAMAVALSRSPPAVPRAHIEQFTAAHSAEQYLALAGLPKVKT
jgi:glycosyltransferase involved in cell wall biosynthesis